MENIAENRGGLDVRGFKKAFLAHKEIPFGIFALSCLEIAAP